jgi:formate C-acetyltransferase
VVDSLLVIKQLVFEEKAVSFAELKQAVDTNFKKNPRLHALVRNRIRRFGSRDPEAVAMARRVTGLVNGFFRNRVNYRGGHYATGWWSMSNHVSYGRVIGALPSGRLDGEPFTPGLTPHPGASANLLDNLMDVALLDPETLDNNIAFNVRLVPGPNDTHQQAVDRMASYAETFIEQGGMQVQFNVVDTDTLKDAMAHPELYRDLMVRISGYCAYFTELVRDLQLEVIRRCEYKM